MNNKKQNFNIEPGVYEGLPMNVYHAHPAISKSGLSLMKQSALHYWNGYLNPERKERTETPAQKLGSAIHTMVLEPLEFNDRYIQAPVGINKRTKEGKSQWAEFEKKANGRILLDDTEFDTVNRAAQAVAGHPLAQHYFSGGKAEVSYFWKDPQTLVECKCRPDYVRANGVLVDLKTSFDASPEQFPKTCVNFGYHMSAFFSKWGYYKVTGHKPPAYIFVVVETKPPFGVAFYELDHQAELLGGDLCMHYLDKFADCQAEEYWPGYSEELETIELPRWAFKEMD